VASENSPIEAERRYPDVAAHLRACGPCSEDLDGDWSGASTTIGTRATPSSSRPAATDLLGAEAARVSDAVLTKPHLSPDLLHVTVP
jgi:hypothetical protein